MCQIIPSVRTATLETYTRRSVMLLFNTRLILLCVLLRYISERVERCADGIEMNVFGEDTEATFGAYRFTTDAFLNVPFNP